MDVEIHLQPEWRSRLLDYVPGKSRVRAALENAVELIGGSQSVDEFVVTCDESELPILREAAREHCPGAVEFIDFAVQRSRLYRSARS
jgi:LSD1 subclass zinc finger protein